MNESVNHLLDSFKQLIHSETNQETVFMNESVNHLFKTADFFRNESLLCADQMHNSSALS